jgi:hypothetical protein
MDRLEELRQLLDAGHRFVEGHMAMESQPETVHSGSPAAVEMGTVETGPAGPWGNSPTLVVIAVAGIYRAAAYDHLGALGKLLEPPVTVWGDVIVARAALEAGARLWWLLEPGLSGRQRVARATTEQLYSAQEFITAERELPVEAGEAQTRLDLVVRYAEELGLKSDLSKDGRLIGFEGERHAGFTKIVSGVLRTEHHAPGGAVARYYSAIAHGTMYGLLERLTTTGDGLGNLSIEPRLTLETLSLTVSAATLAVAQGYDQWVEYLGWDRWGWARWHNQMITVLNRDARPQ